MRYFVSLLVGLIFGLGLLVSGMANPAKVLGFLDLAGAWDPSLALVMLGAIGVSAVAFAIANTMRSSWIGETMRLPTASRIDARLILGSLAFGIGWGLAGLCPGPALVGLASGHIKVAVFTIAMLSGMALHRVLDRA